MLRGDVKRLNTEYDVIIVGLGPAGVTSLYELSRLGFKVLGVESSKILANKPCGEAVPKQLFSTVKINPDEVNSYPVRNVVIDLEGKKKLLQFKSVVGYIIDKRLLLELIVKNAIDEGATTLLGVSVENVEADGRVKLATGDVIRGQVVICSDGVLGPCFRHFKHYTFIGAYQCKAQCRICEDETLYLYFRRDLTGYMWLFPKSNNMCNVGVGGLKIKPKHYMEHLLKTLTSKFNLRILRCDGGAIPALGPIGNVVNGRLIAIGDRAGTAMSFTGEGIRPAIISSIYASKKVREFLDGVSNSLNYLKEFMKEWGWRIDNSSKMLRMFLKTPGFLRKIVIERLNEKLALKVLFGETLGLTLKYG